MAVFSSLASAATFMSTFVLHEMELCSAQAAHLHATDRNGVVHGNMHKPTQTIPAAVSNIIHSHVTALWGCVKTLYMWLRGY